MSDANKATVKRFVEELFVKGNLDVLDELVADDYVDHTPPPDLPPGKAGLEQLATMFRNAFPDLAISEEDVIAEGDKVVMRQVTTGTHQGDFWASPPPARRWRCTRSTSSGSPTARSWSIGVWRTTWA